MLTNDIFNRLVSSYEAIRYEGLNETIVVAHDHLCREMGISGFIPMNSIRDFDREHIADPVLDFLTSKDIDPNLRLSYFEYLIQSAFVSNPNFAHIENNIAAAINKPLKRVGLPSNSEAESSR